MRRRRVLAGFAGLAGASFAGCLSTPRSRGVGAGPPPGAVPPPPADQSEPAGIAPEAVDLPVKRSTLQRATTQDAIPAITEPAFGPDYAGIDATLDDEDLVIGVARGEGARAYPLAVLSRHEVVNDDFGGPLLVTFCPLCGSGMVAVREVDDTPTVFGVSGLLYRSNLVLYDRLTRSLWSQILATAINGRRTGDQLTLVPSGLTTWGTWRKDHPDTSVLLPAPHSGVIEEPYGRDLSPGHDGGPVGVGQDYADVSDRRLDPLTTVLGVTEEGVSRAYPFEAVAAAGVVEDAIAGRPIAVATSPGGTLFGYDRRVAGFELSFRKVGSRFLGGGGSRWTVATGRAVDGPFEGWRLTSVGIGPIFWHAWVGFHSGTEVYGE